LLCLHLHGCSNYVLYKFTAYKTTTILLDGKRVRLQVWDTSGQGRFCTIIRSYSRGAQGVLLVYDITSKWSFDGIDRWVKEVEEVYNTQYFLHCTKMHFYKIRYYILLFFNFSTLLEFQKYLLVIDFTWLSSDKLVKGKQKCMLLKTEWHSLKSVLCAISIFGRASVSFLEWRCTEMVWKGCGDQTKVIFLLPS
jgi:GTPase SAR1 family protein